MLNTGRIDAVLDVTEPEIPDAASPLYTLPNVFLTPHVAGAVGLERTRLGDMAVDEVIRFVNGEPLLTRYARQIWSESHEPFRAGPVHRHFPQAPRRPRSQRSPAGTA